VNPLLEYDEAADAAYISFSEQEWHHQVRLGALAERHGLTVWDALYLQLALDVDGEFATLDGDLIRAARAEEVAVVS
jgi:predicted nucleic acid-binding protein